MAGPARHPDAHGGHARPAAPREARRRRQLDRDGARRWLSFPRTARTTEAAPRMKLATRLFASIGLLVAAAVLGSILPTSVLLRRHLEAEVAVELEREARLVAALTPVDSSRWPDFAMLAGQAVGGGRRVTLIDSSGRVRGDTEFDRAALARLQNHRDRPEVRAAMGSASGVGTNTRLSASTNERQLYVAVREPPPPPPPPPPPGGATAARPLGRRGRPGARGSRGRPPPRPAPPPAPGPSPPLQP